MFCLVYPGFYTVWLLPAAIVGTVVFFSGIMTMGSNTPASVSYPNAMLLQNFSETRSLSVSKATAANSALSVCVFFLCL